MHQYYTSVSAQYVDGLYGNGTSTWRSWIWKTVSTFRRVTLTRALRISNDVIVSNAVANVHVLTHDRSDYTDWS